MAMINYKCRLREVIFLQCLFTKGIIKASFLFIIPFDFIFEENLFSYNRYNENSYYKLSHSKLKDNEFNYNELLVSNTLATSHMWPCVLCIMFSIT
jgi:hypothetical protein